jgi:glycosyltransferase involved in cell wall biosynthesis
MRVVFHTRPPLLEPALHFAREMSRLTEFHLLLELEPRAWSAMFASAPAIHESGILPADPILSLHPASLPVSHAAIRFVRELEPDVLHFDDVSLRMVLNYPELPPIDFLSVHDPEVHSGEQDWRRDLSRWLTFRKVKRFILHNEAQVERFCSGYRVPSNRVDVSHLGAYTLSREWKTSSVIEESQTILFFGRISQYKGLDRLYQAMSLVAERVPGVRLVVAGRPEFGYRLPPPPVLTHGGRIDVLTRYIPNSEVAELMQRATVVVCPYTDATQSGVVLTAYAFDKPVVSTNVGGLPEYVHDGESGLVVPADNAEELASALTRVLVDGALRSRLSRGVARLVANELGWPARAARMLAIYQQAREEA